MIDNKMVIDSEWNDWLSNPQKDYYEDATNDDIIRFLEDSERLHEVVAYSLDIDAGHYDELVAEELFLEALKPVCQTNMLLDYLDTHDISNEYNEWYKKYHSNEAYRE